MKLELKESNSPFWVLGLDHGKITVGSFTNKPCYYKSSKKWYEFAKQIINQPRIDEVYLITGVEWDNMKGSWSAKEAGSYVQNKGKLILSKNEITTYEKKYGPIEVNEGNFPKGMSKDPLPKKGVKTYTSSATTLEGDEKMKLELKEKTNEDSTSNLLTKDELQKLRNEIVIGSIYLSDYDNSFGIENKYVMDLFDGYVEDTWEKILEYRNDYFADKSELSDEELFKSEIENIDSMYDYYTSVEDNQVVKSSLTENKMKLKEKTNEDVYIFESNIDSEDPANAKELWDDINVVKKENGKECKIIKSSKLPGFPNEFEDMIHDIEFDDGTVINNVFGKFLTYKEPSKKVEEGATKLEKGEGDTFENAGTTWKVLAQNEEDTLIVALDSDGNERNKFVVAWGLQSDGSWNQGHYFQDKEKAKKYFEKRAKKIESLKESKIVTPVGNPQTAGSFVNIDVDLDHMEVSDFIVRLAQAIRSEQTAVLEYVALRSANGITNEDRNVIDGIMKEEKNHMAALTALLYKQILMNHKENVDEANNEFILPKFGADLFDENNKLTESISNVLNKIITESSHDGTNDEYTVGDRESARIYNGLSNTLNVIKNIISTSDEEVVVQNVTLSDNSKIVKEANIMTAEEISQIDVSKIQPTQKDFDRADELLFRGHTFRGDNLPWASEANKMAKLIKDPIKLIRRAKAVYAAYGDKYSPRVNNTGYYITNYQEDGDKEVDVWTPFNDALKRMGFTVDQIKTLKDTSKNLKESLKESTMTIDDLINELKTDTNYDEIAYHIHEYSKTDKKKASELMDLLFELENNKSPKECVDEIINHLTMIEDTKITPKDNKYNIEIDVEYDLDVANQIFDNIAREVEEYNKNNEINLSNLGLKDGKFYFTVNKEVDEQMVKDICDEIFDKATNYEYQIIIA
ncbi:MAG: hypothetical protein SPJ27_07835 [Candidatus Onthovivens sp.]|nr:hypothetical protein [Candidatus Onthovivens sp.]